MRMRKINRIFEQNEIFVYRAQKTAHNKLPITRSQTNYRTLAAKGNIFFRWTTALFTLIAANDGEKKKWKAIASIRIQQQKLISTFRMSAKVKLKYDFPKKMCNAFEIGTVVKMQKMQW